MSPAARVLSSSLGPDATLGGALLSTKDDRVALGLRLTLGAIMFPHGAQHALGWFGGYGFAGTYGWMTGTLGIPGPLAALAIVTEILAPAFLILGLGGRIAAAGLGAVLAVAATTHLSNGLFMNWTGSQAGEGFEYHVLGVAIAAALAVRGSGALSLDRWLWARAHASDDGCAYGSRASLPRCEAMASTTSPVSTSL